MGIFKKLKEHKEKAYFSAHMPGHKSGSFIPEELKDAFGKNVFAFDVTELEGLDNLQEPQGIIKVTEEKIAKIAGAKKAFILVNGSTVGLLAAIYTLARREEIFVGANAHQAVYNAMVLADSRPIFLVPEVDQETGTELGISPEILQEAVKKYPKCKIIVLTFPNYYGIRYKYKEILKIAKENNLKIIIDEAHGAHFNFMGANYPNGINIGADVVIQSWHKTLPVLNQGSLLLTGNNLNTKTEEYNFRKSINIFQTSSPSYLIMSSMDSAVEFLQNKEKEILVSGEKWQKTFRGFKLKNLKVFRSKEDYPDPFKLLIYSLKEPEKLFKDIIVKKYKLQPEIMDNGILLFMLPLIFDQELANKIVEALVELDLLLTSQKKLVKEVEPTKEKIFRIEKTPQEMSFMRSKNLPILESVGRVCAEKIVKYPPGIPFAYPGEILTEEIVCYLNRHKINYKLQEGIKIFIDQEN